MSCGECAARAQGVDTLTLGETGLLVLGQLCGDWLLACRTSHHAPVPALWRLGHTRVLTRPRLKSLYCPDSDLSRNERRR
jgi:hypothetical protein